MTKVYVVQWGYYSSNDGGQEWDSIWTSEEGAKKRIRDEAGSRHIKHISKVFTNSKKKLQQIYLLYRWRLLD